METNHVISVSSLFFLTNISFSNWYVFTKSFILILLFYFRFIHVNFHALIQNQVLNYEMGRLINYSLLKIDQILWLIVTLSYCWAGVLCDLREFWTAYLLKGLLKLWFQLKKKLLKRNKCFIYWKVKQQNFWWMWFPKPF